MELAYIGLGANLNAPLETIKKAIVALSQLPNSKLVAQSKIYASKPMGPVDQPDYVNAVVLLETSLSPHELFEQTCQIEQDHGRVRNGEHWGPRTLDLDLLLFGEQTLNDELLTVPHYGIKDREFVVMPLLDINPDLTLPCGTNLQNVSNQLPLNGLTAIK